ncbi:PREDICTED: helicase SEN1 isoform X2 [Rhagoletis zephyria]|uniref:helicase SEN1 isoform X2 n=1 Tax=Rhagoletis zephyria TaxID=28612 RepID=UPI0008112D81|nr:PREDICTED: helicase SEN1 isoform X2 [Rhagoletis zephyria]
MSDMANRVLSSWLLERKVIGDRLRLLIGVTQVGRQPGLALCIDSGFVSRKHAEITVDQDGRIVLKDLNSANGTFVNGIKIKNGEIVLKANDCIGVGVTDDSEPNLKHPIYNLIYAPMPGIVPIAQAIDNTKDESIQIGNKRKAQQESPELPSTSSAISTSDQQATKYTTAVTTSDLKSDNIIGSSDTNQISSIATNEVVCTKSTTEVKYDKISESKAKPASLSSKLPTLFSGQIIILSDDEDDVVRSIKEECKQSSNIKDYEDSIAMKDVQPSGQNNSNEEPPNRIGIHKTNNATPDIPNNAAVHEPILPEVKREFVRSCTENVVEIFGGTDDVILESVKEINPLLYSRLNGKKTNKMLYDGDSIDLLSDNEDDDPNIAHNVETFGELLPAAEYNKHSEKADQTKNIAVENELMQNASLKKSPNVFDNSLNSSNGDEQRNCIIEHADIPEDNRNLEPSTVNSAKAPDELAEFVDMDDDMLFSQILLNDIKSEMMADNNEAEFADEDHPYDVIRKQSQENLIDTHIKKEIVDNEQTNSAAIPVEQKLKDPEIGNDVWITIEDDDEYYDEEFEHKVSDWSSKLLSQTMNMSQVFEFQNDKAENLDDNDENAEGKEDQGLDCASEDLDDFFNEALVDDVIATLAQKTGQTKSDSKSSPLEQEMSKDSYEYDRSKELVHQKDKIKSIEDYKEAPVEIKTTRELNDEPEDLKASTSSKPTVADSKKTDTSKEKIKVSKKEVIKPVKRLHHPPSVIDAPNLPKHKGKHRGVSAESRSIASSTKEVRTKAAAFSGQLKEERYMDELKRKWLGKPVDERRREIEKKRLIRESRKERLKELADKQSADTSKELLKRKHASETEVVEKKKAKVKITTMNRGALLAEDIEASKKNVELYRIPKIKRCSSESTKPHKESSTSATVTTPKSNRPKAVDAFAQEMSKLDKIISRRISSSSNRKTSRSSSTEENRNGSLPTEAKPCNAPARKTNKITFASMQKNFSETKKNQELLQRFASHRSCLTNVIRRDADKERLKKRVRFNETPIVYYIERVSGANKRVDRKDILPSPTCQDRAHMVRMAYAMVDKTAQIISQILGWSNEWLVNRNAQVDAASDILLPMPNQFTTFNHYKSIIIPLMKLEFMSVLEREKSRCKSKTFIVSAEQVTPYLDRFIIIGRCAGTNSSESKSELVILEWGKFTTFAYMSSKRFGFNYTTIVYEVLANDLSLEELRANSNNPIKVRPMIDVVRVEFGAFNAVYQLEQSPLLAQILDPMQLCKRKPFTQCNIQYNGCDDLNARQKEVLIRTYRRAIEPTPNITLIQGPPGTGKSCVIANLVHQLLYGNEIRILDQKVLICAQSNAAVDVIAEKLFNMGQKKLPDVQFRLIRFGLMERISPKVRHATLPKIIERNQIRKLKVACTNLQIDDKIDIKEYLRNEIIQIEADIEHMKQKNVKGTAQEEELIAKVRQVQLMRNIVNGVLRPEDERSLYNWHLKNANVVCTTLSSCVKLSQYVNYFDVCIIDEATQCTEPWTLMPLKFGINTLVLVGDTQQLPATVLSKKASDFGLGTSLFTRIQRCIESVNLKNAANGLTDEEKIFLSDSNDIIFSLQTQYRMHPEICKWPNSYFYKNELIDDPKTHQFKTPLKPFSVLNLTYTQDENCHRGQIANELEAKFVARLVKTLDGYIPMKYNSYGVITPYAQQRGALEKALRNYGFLNVMVNTIDSYQGMECDVIIISNARTTGIGFLANYQRLNVALTRPKKCLILCGNFKNLEAVPAWRSLLASARERKLYHELSADCMDDMHRSVIPKIKISKPTVTADTATATTRKELLAVVPTLNQ